MKARAPEAPMEMPSPERGFFTYYASGGRGDRASIMAFLGQRDYLGEFFSGIEDVGLGGRGGNPFATGQTFGQTAAYRDIMNAWRNGGTASLINRNGYYSYWTNTSEGSGTLTNHKEKINNEIEWYGPGGKINFGIGTTASTIGFVQGSFRLTDGIYNGSAWSPKYYPSAWTGGSRARITTYNFSKIGRGLGRFSVGVGFIMDAKGVQIHLNDPTSPNAVHPGKAGLNTAMGILGTEGGIYGAIISILYFGVDNFYPVGWVGASETAARVEAYEQQTTGHPFFNNSAIKF